MSVSSRTAKKGQAIAKEGLIVRFPGDEHQTAKKHRCWFIAGKKEEWPEKKLNWQVLSDEQMSKEWAFSLLNDEQMSNWLGVEHCPVNDEVEEEFCFPDVSFKCHLI